jgi:hypothetical protein
MNQPYTRFLIVLDFLPEDGWPEYQMYFGKIINMGSTRYQVFKRNRQCVFCGVEGIFMALEQDRGSSKRGQSPHFNLYTINKIIRYQNRKVAQISCIIYSVPV